MTFLTTFHVDMMEMLHVDTKEVMKTIKDSLSINIRKLRHSKDMTQSEMAEATGMSERNYQRVEKGDVEPGLDFLEKFSKVVGVSADALLRDPFAKPTEKRLTVADMIPSSQSVAQMSKEDLKLMMKDVARGLLKKGSDASSGPITAAPTKGGDPLEENRKKLIAIIPLLPPNAVGVLLGMAELSLKGTGRSVSRNKK